MLNYPQNFPTVYLAIHYNIYWCAHLGHEGFLGLSPHGDTNSLSSLLCIAGGWHDLWDGAWDQCNDHSGAQEGNNIIHEARGGSKAQGGSSDDHKAKGGAKLFLKHKGKLVMTVRLDGEQSFPQSLRRKQWQLWGQRGSHAVHKGEWHWQHSKRGRILLANAIGWCPLNLWLVVIHIVLSEQSVGVLK